MAHPDKKSAVASHSAKLKRMTKDYGLGAGPSENRLAPVDRAKGTGPFPEDDVGFGADASMARARGDVPARRSIAANPLATYKKGGRIRARAQGGRVKKGATNVNVIVAPQAAQPQPNPMQMAALGPPPAPPPPPASAPPMGGPPGGGMPTGPIPPGAMPPGIMPPRAKGGRVDMPQSQGNEVIEKTLREEGLVRRARGGRAYKYTAGAGSGEGRLEKIAAYGRRTANAKAQTV